MQHPGADGFAALSSMDTQSAILSIIDGPWPALTPADLDSLIDQCFQAFRPANLDGHNLVKAISMMESSGGKNCQPRHEKAYCTGIYSKSAAMVRLTTLYGHSSHCSFGPWQLMFVNCPAGMNPAQMHDAQECARATSDFLVRLNIRLRPQTVEQWGQLYNGGHIGASNPGVNAYVGMLQKYYDTFEQGHS
jgi:hypothetical protein